MPMTMALRGAFCGAMTAVAFARRKLYCDVRTGRSGSQHSQIMLEEIGCRDRDLKIFLSAKVIGED